MSCDWAANCWMCTDSAMTWPQPWRLFKRAYSRWPRHGMDTLTHRILTRHDTELIDTIDIDTPWHATFRTWHAKNNMTRQKNGTTFLKIFFTHVPTSWGHVKKSGTKFLKIFFTHVPTSWRHVKSLGSKSWKSFSPIKNGTKFLEIFFTNIIWDQPPQNIFHSWKIGNKFPTIFFTLKN